MFHFTSRFSEVNRKEKYYGIDLSLRSLVQRHVKNVLMYRNLRKVIFFSFILKGTEYKTIVTGA